MVNFVTLSLHVEQAFPPRAIVYLMELTFETGQSFTLPSDEILWQLYQRGNGWS